MNATRPARFMMDGRPNNAIGLSSSQGGTNRECQALVESVFESFDEGPSFLITGQVGDSRGTLVRVPRIWMV